MTRTPDEVDFLYTNRDDAWLDFARRDLDVVAGSLQLAGLPAPDGPLPDTLAAPVVSTVSLPLVTETVVVNTPPSESATETPLIAFDTSSLASCISPGRVFTGA